MSRARYLRKNATKYERILWRRLRNRNFAGHKFRRQHPIDPYVLDFYSPSLKLAIELDGSGHAYSLKKKHDQRRNQFLASEGIVVLRFWNRQIREELDSVLRAIWFAVEDRTRSPSPQSSPRLRGEAENHLPSDRQELMQVATCKSKRFFDKVNGRLTRRPNP